jgi:hypothetical protein
MNQIAFKALNQACAIVKAHEIAYWCRCEDNYLDVARSVDGWTYETDLSDYCRRVKCPCACHEEQGDAV